MIDFIVRHQPVIITAILVVVIVGGYAIVCKQEPFEPPRRR